MDWTKPLISLPTASRSEKGKKSECKKKKFLIEEKFSIKRNTSTMSSHQAISAQHRQATWSELAKLKEVAPKSLSYPRSNAKLQKYKAEISQIQEVITNEEATRLRNIDLNPHYKVIFERRDQVHVGGKITDSNFIADIAIDTPGKHDYMELLSANSATIQSILQDEQGRLGPIKALIRSVLIQQSGLKIQVDPVQVDASTQTEMYGPVRSSFGL
jgi:hypothetical protein